jgi:lipopolysaccharide/colanic/teichoic acid biosynthesis glycosyltransferase
MGDAAQEGRELYSVSVGVPESIGRSPTFESIRRAYTRRSLFRSPIWRYGRSIISSGYYVENAAVYRAWNLALATLLLLVFALPLVTTSLVLLIAQGRPVFYRGVRLGKDQRPFFICKFRTLREGAGMVTMDRVLPARSGMETPLGAILRESRLDEVPQLFNVIKGEMNIFGPRPVRPEMAGRLMASIPGYETRFNAKPGIVGHVQAFMTHRTPKRVRSFYNGYLLRRKAYIWKEIIILGLIGWGVAGSLAKMTVAHVTGLTQRKFGAERRKARRIRLAETIVSASGNGLTIEDGILVDINDEAFSVCLDRPVVGGRYSFALKRPLNTGKIKIARCHGVLQPMRGGSVARNGVKVPNRYLVNITHVSQLNDYLIDRYFRGNSFLK